MSAAYRPRSKSRRRAKAYRRPGPPATVAGFGATLKSVWGPSIRDGLYARSPFLEGLSGTPGQKAAQRAAARRTFPLRFPSGLAQVTMGRGLAGGDLVRFEFDQRIAEYRFFELPREQLLDMLEEMS